MQNLLKEKKLHIFALILYLVLIFTNCTVSRISFTPSLIAKYSLDTSDIKKLQFYLKNSMTLERLADSKSSVSTESHKLITRQGKTYEIIHFRARTPGIVDRIAGKYIYVSFEPGKTIAFAPGRNTASDLYVNCHTEKEGYLTYGGKLYKFSNPAYLQIDKDSLSRVRYLKRTVPGRRKKIP